MRLGKVRFYHEYTVDLDVPGMADAVKGCLVDDLCGADTSWIVDGVEVIEDPAAMAADIPEWAYELCDAPEVPAK